jgi:hypothetical protein
MEDTVLMNALIQQVIGEASFDRQAGVIGFTPRRTPMPSQSADELVQQHLDTQGAGVPPAGRQYPSMPAESPVSHAQEENREVQIAGSIKLSVKELQDALIEGGYHRALTDSRIKIALEKIHSGAVELTSLHTNAGS